MDWHIWAAFVAASALMGLIPGPGVTSIVGYAITAGRKTALASVAGMAIGNAVAMTLSMAGVGALLAASALAFTTIKWVGALYLIGLGLITIFKSRNFVLQNDGQSMAVTPRTAFAGNIAIGTFHPKTIIFFVAFVPQFINVGGNYAVQATLLIFTFCAVVAGTDTIYALVAARAAKFLRGPRVGLWSQRAGGGLLVAAGIATAATRK